jgi:hypothetical protein
MTKKAQIPRGYKATRLTLLGPGDVVDELLAAVRDPELARRLEADPHLNVGPILGASTVATVALLRGVEALRAAYYPEPYDLEEHPEAPQVHVDLPVYGAAALRYFALVGIEAEGQPYDSSSPEAATRFHGKIAAEALEHQIRRAAWDHRVHQARMRATVKARVEWGAPLALSDDGGRLHYRLQGEAVPEGAVLEFFYQEEWVTAKFHWSGVLGERPLLLDVPGCFCPYVPLSNERLRWPAKSLETKDTF